MKIYSQRVPVLIILLFSVAAANADGVSIDKIYDPYVEQLEREIEYRTSYYNYDEKNKRDIIFHRLGVGYSFSPGWFAEIYLIGEKEQDGSLTLDSYEIEAKWQFTEQGEYLFDWAFLFEFEDKKNIDVFEFATTLISSLETGRWVTTANLAAIFEWSDDVQNEFETAFSIQTRFRYKRELEFGLELYTGQDTRGLGPIIMGVQKLKGRKKLSWEFAAIYGLDSDEASLTPALTIKGGVEFEF